MKILHMTAEKHLRSIPTHHKSGSVQWWVVPLIIVLVYVAPASPLAERAELENYIREGLRNNESIKQQVFLLDRNLYALKEATSLFFPNISFDAMYTRAAGGRTIDFPVGTLLNPVYSTLNALTNSERFPQLQDQHVLLNPDNYYDAKFHITLPIVHAEIYFNRKIRSALITLQQAEVNVYKRELVKEIKIGYYRYWQALQAVMIYENGLRLAGENERITRSLFTNGKANRTSVVRAENELKKIEAALAEAKHSRSSAKNYFNFLLNKPLESDIVIHNMSISDTIADASMKRDELTKLEAANDIQSYSHTLAWSFLIPKVGAFLDAGSQGFDGRFDRKTRYYFFGVSFEWSLLSTGRDFFKTQEALAEVHVGESQLDYAEQQIRLQCSVARDAYNTSLTSYESAATQVDGASKYFADVTTLYKGGQALYIELLDAQNQLIDAQLQESIARSNVLIRIAELERANASFDIDQTTNEEH